MLLITKNYYLFLRILLCFKKSSYIFVNNCFYFVFLSHGCWLDYKDDYGDDYKELFLSYLILKNKNWVLKFPRILLNFFKFILD